MAILLSTVLLALPLTGFAPKAAQGVSPKDDLTVMIAHNPIKVKQNSTLAPVGLIPSQIKKAYGLDTVAATGKNQTIGIVVAYGSPTIASDLSSFSKKFGLPTASLTIATPQGRVKTNAGWALETSLDVEWAHALAPDAKILLVEAKSASLTDLLGAEDYAASHGAQVINNSWGASEFATEGKYDSYFTKLGVTYVAASGDSGAGVSWPASSPSVLAVGGTTLKLDASGNYDGESGWSGSGGGISAYVAEPTYQSSLYSLLGGKRGVADVAFNADPNTGVTVYCSTKQNGISGWFQVGGTSFSAPAWSAMVALANEGRPLSLSSADVLSKVYSLANSASYTTNFNDIVSGYNGYQASVGYDLVTGLGSAKANNLIPALRD
ncbi:MAG: S53 family peptidase [Desulfosporosinus sp.]|nr:S53 family peptidase [Desulfosporosinus sp.]